MQALPEENLSTIREALSLTVRLYSSDDAANYHLFPESDLETFEGAYQLFLKGNTVTLTRFVGSHVAALDLFVSKQQQQKAKLDDYLNGKGSAKIQYEYGRFDTVNHKISETIGALSDIHHQLKTLNSPEEKRFLVSERAGAGSAGISVKISAVLNQEVMKQLESQSSPSTLTLYG